MPTSLIITDQKGRKLTNYKYDFPCNCLLRSDSSSIDSVWVEFRVYPPNLQRIVANKDSSMVRTGKGGMIQPFQVGPSTRDILPESGSIQRSGSISRGLAFGNTQNLSVNSTLNLQLSGRITQRYNILASITDDNIPIQPNGNTRQLQDFDRIFIQIFDDQSKLIAGDFIIRKPEGYFVNYFKRAQGAYFETKRSLQSGRIFSAEVSASVSKGRFARNVIQGIEGNQGPYRLTGAENELFIVVLAGTEAVYIDGRLLERGQDKDYIIDYNAAEIIFTPKQFITKDRRITVEFQYSDRRYARPMIHSSLQYGNQASLTYLNVFSESDARNQPLQQELTNDEKLILSNSGDRLLQAAINGIDSLGFNSNEVLYALIDSLGFDSVLVYSNDPAKATYRARFSLVGSGNGDYVEDGFTAFGRKYRWVSPIVSDGTIIRQGNYAPLVLLVSPKKRQVVSVGHKKEWNNGSKAWIEGAASINDVNTFSPLDSRNDDGWALKSGWNIYLSKPNKRSRWFTLGQFEYTSTDFIGVERFREVEFDRNWNRLGLDFLSDFHWISTGLGLDNKEKGQWNVGAAAIRNGSGYSGQRLQGDVKWKTKRWSWNGNAFALQTAGLRNSSFVRHVNDAGWNVGKWRLQFKDEHELNRLFIDSSDTLQSNSYQWYDWQVGIGTQDTLRTSFSIYYRDRIDRRARNTNLDASTRADEYGFKFQHRSLKDNKFTMMASNRRLRVIDPELFTAAPENTLVGRAEYYYKAPSSWLVSSTFYEIGSGLEQRREFVYFEVPAGQGSYVWIDYNNNGIKELNEFEVARFEYEANYIRSFIQTTDYVRTYTNQFSQSVQIQPGRNWKKDSAWKKFVARWSNQASYKIERKTDSEEGTDRFNPFLSDVLDSVLITLNSSVRNVLFFNKSHPVFGADYTIQQVRNRNLLSNGFESRGDDYHLITGRWNFYREFIFSTEQRFGRRIISSDFLQGRNYELKVITTKPRLTWQPNGASRLIAVSEYTTKENIQGLERAVILSYGLEFALNSTEKGSFQGNINFYRITYNGEGNNSLAFDMLDGLNAGFNSTWNVSLQRTVAKNLQLIINYNGRKPEGVPTVHAGGVQVRAFF